MSSRPDVASSDQLPSFPHFGREDLYFEGNTTNIRSCPSVTVISWTRLLSFDKGLLFGVKADMEELSAVGEQVFDAECILNKRLRKVRAVKHSHSYPAGFYSPSSGCFQTCFLLFQGKLEFLVKWRGWSSK